jgi:hypothetical protein
VPSIPIALDAGPSGVALAGDRLLWSAGKKLRLFSVNEPTTPTLLAETNLGSAAGRIELDGSTAYCLVRGRGIMAVDIGTTGSLTLIHAIDTPGTELGIHVADGRLYYTGGEAGLHVYGIDDPTTAPLHLGSYGAVRGARSKYDHGTFLESSHGAADVIVDGGVDYLADGDLQVLDVSDPKDIRKIGGYEPLTWARYLHKQGNLLFVSFLFSGPAVFDVSDPAEPRLTGLALTETMTPVMASEGDWLYMLSTLPEGGMFVVPILLAIDVSNPTRPRLASTLELERTGASIAIQGSIAYVSDLEGGLSLIELYRPESPQFIRRIIAPLR